HDDVHASTVQFVNESLKTIQFVERRRWIFVIKMLDGEERVWIVSPTESTFGPCCPRHELNCVHAEILKVIELVPHCIKRSTRIAILSSEIVEHELVDD